MQILAIGDPHGDLTKLRNVPLKGMDLILLTGDLGDAALARKIAFENIAKNSSKNISPSLKKRIFFQTFNSAVKIVKHLSKTAPVFTIFGNVEPTNYETRKKSREVGETLPLLSNELNAMKNVKVINNKLVNFKGLKIGGLQYFTDTNWVNEFKPPDFKKRLAKAKKQTERAKNILKKFKNIDILLCHQPPYKLLDKVTAPYAPKQWQGKHAGSITIRRYIEKNQPKYVFCGHIHEGKGSKKISKSEVYNLGVAGYKIVEF